MARYRVYSIEFKKQVVQAYLGGEYSHGLSKRHQVSRNLIRVWIANYESGEFDDEQAAAAERYHPQGNYLLGNGRKSFLGFEATVCFARTFSWTTT